MIVRPCDSLSLSGCDALSFDSERGALSLLSNTLLGVAKAASGITGSVGHGVAFLSLDYDFIRQRQQRAITKASTGFKDDLWRGIVEPLRGS